MDAQEKAGALVEDAIDKKVDPAVARLMAASVANYHTIVATGRADGKNAAEAARLLAFATSMGFNEPMYRGDGPITAKTINRERKRVIQWVRQHKPSVHEAFLKAEKQLRERYVSMRKPQTTPSETDSTPQPAA